MGCKSARDRTAVLAGAIKTMQENPQAMHDWNVLDQGIVKSLQQGHHFRAMAYHVAVVKVSDVHWYFKKKLPKQINDAIGSLKVFSKTLGETEDKSVPAVEIQQVQPKVIDKKQAWKILDEIHAKIVDFATSNLNFVKQGYGEKRKISDKTYSLPKHLAKIYDVYLYVEKNKNKVDSLKALRVIQDILAETNSKFDQTFFTFGRDPRTQKLYVELDAIANNKTAIAPDVQVPRSRNELR
jgi:hypothetical protein